MKETLRERFSDEQKAHTQLEAREREEQIKNAGKGRTMYFVSFLFLLR